MSGSDDSQANYSSFEGEEEEDEEEGDSYSDVRPSYANKTRGRNTKPRNQSDKNEAFAPHSAVVRHQNDSRRRVTRGNKRGYQESDDDEAFERSLMRNDKRGGGGSKEAANSQSAIVEEHPSLPQSSGQQHGGVFDPDVDLILWKRPQHVGSDESEYFVKLKDRSYLHCKWMSHQELANGLTGTKYKLNRFNKNFQSKVEKGELDFEQCENGIYFDNALAEADRILSCAELFPIIHPKKANEIKGKWHETLTWVASKLLNFSKDTINYGVFFNEPVDPESDEGCPDYLRVITNPMDLGTISNRVFLDYYRASSAFFVDLGFIFKNCRQYHKDAATDIRILCDTLREASILIYNEWHEVEARRYAILRKESTEATTPISSNGDIAIAVSQLKSLIEEECDFNSSVRTILDKHARYIPALATVIDTTTQPEHLVRRLVTHFVNIHNTNHLQAKHLLLEQQQTESCEEDKQLGKEERLTKLIESLVVSARSRKSTKLPTLTLEEVELYNPGKYSLAWLIEGDQTSAEVLREEPVYLSSLDIEQISFTTEVDMLYLIKWKNQSYIDGTWEPYSAISNPNKVMDYKMQSRALDRDSRVILTEQLNRHRFLCEISGNPKKQAKMNNNSIIELRNRLYFYDISAYKKPFLYNQKNQPIFKQRKLLRSYQLDSLNWMIESWYARRNVILADEMGLGKTIQATAFLNHLFHVEQVRGPFLVVAPLSLLEHWKRSVEDWTNMNVVLYYDQNGLEGRNSCRDFEWFHTDISTKGTVLQSAEIYKFQVLITSNEVFVSDTQQFLESIPFQFIVIDEAHRLKNINARFLAALKRLQCRRTLLLTGTPIQNNTEELWTLLNYIEPNKFSSIEHFKREFGELQNKEQVDHLQTKIKPYLLRRMKEDVENSIPPLQETIIDIEMTTIQKTLYRAMYERNRGMLQQTFSSSAVGATFNNLEIQLRKCCNHPFLIKEIEEDLTASCETDAQRFKVLIETSGKFILLDKLVMKYKAEGKKILVFSQFVYVLQLIEEFLRYRQLKYEKIDGSVKSRERQISIDRFNDPSKGRDVFLLSTKAGGLGINLTSASIVIIFDSDWNPQNDVQATARAHRIGQTQEVSVFRFITKKTYEAEMFERATKKLGLDQAIFMGGEFKQVASIAKDDPKKLGKADIENLLRKGILGLVNEDEESKKSHEFFEDDIDSIIKKNSRIAKYSVINGSYSFSKGSFISNHADTDLKIDDPNFWVKVLKQHDSKSQRALKEVEGFASNSASKGDVAEQTKTLHKVCEFVNDIVAQKLSEQGFTNGDDEKNITDALNLIAASKVFHYKFKEIAVQLSYEVQRPSRRYKRITLKDLEAIVTGEKKKQKRSKEDVKEERKSLDKDEQQFKAIATSTALAKPSAQEVTLYEEDDSSNSSISSSDDGGGEVEEEEEEEEEEEVEKEEQEEDVRRPVAGRRSKKVEEEEFKKQIQAAVEASLAKTEEIVREELRSPAQSTRKQSRKQQQEQLLASSNTKGTPDSSNKFSGKRQVRSPRLQSQQSAEGVNPSIGTVAAAGATIQSYSCARDEDSHRKLCYVCDKPRCTVFCADICRRAFHEECKAIGEIGFLGEGGKVEKKKSNSSHQPQQFICADCKVNASICFICKVKGTHVSVKTSQQEAGSSLSNALKRCSTTNCNKSYHQACLEQQSLVRFLDPKQTRFRCPLHYCEKCNITGEGSHLAQCVKCPTAQHLRCIDKLRVARLARKAILCEKHTGEPGFEAVIAALLRTPNSEKKIQVKGTSEGEAIEEEVGEEEGGVATTSAIILEEEEKTQKKKKRKYEANNLGGEVLPRKKLKGNSSSNVDQSIPPVDLKGMFKMLMETQAVLNAKITENSSSSSKKQKKKQPQKKILNGGPMQIDLTSMSQLGEAVEEEAKAEEEVLLQQTKSATSKNDREERNRKRKAGGLLLALSNNSNVKQEPQQPRNEANEPETNPLVQESNIVVTSSSSSSQVETIPSVKSQDITNEEEEAKGEAQTTTTRSNKKHLQQQKKKQATTLSQAQGGSSNSSNSFSQTKKPTSTR